MRFYIILTAIMLAGCVHEDHDAARGDAGDLAFFCSGAEPFWTLTVEEDRALLKKAGEGGVESIELEGGWIDDDIADGVVAWQAHGIEIPVRRETCFSPAGAAFEFATDLYGLFPMSSAAPGCCRRD